MFLENSKRLAVFDIQELREVTAYDELELDTIGDRKTALFLNQRFSNGDPYPQAAPLYVRRPLLLDQMQRFLKVDV